jgi:peptidoglycan LD-endopeptidase CwlK
MTWKLSKRSKERLEGVHPDLVRVVHRALQLSPIDFGISEGLRTRERQIQLKKAGASKTLNSRHLSGHAVDVVAYIGKDVRWDWPLYEQIAVAFKQAAKELDVPIVWGGDWTTLRDGPHYELSWSKYK